MAQTTFLQSYGAAPTLGDLETIAREVLSALPETFRKAAGNIVVKVEDFPDDKTMEELDLETPFDILGLYRGVNLMQRSLSDQPTDMDFVFLFRRPILDEWCERQEDLTRLVRHVLVHEIGHHLGFSDDEMERVEHLT